MPMTEVHGAQWVTFFSSQIPAAAPMTTDTAISMPSDEASMYRYHVAGSWGLSGICEATFEHEHGTDLAWGQRGMLLTARATPRVARLIASRTVSAVVGARCVASVALATLLAVPPSPVRAAAPPRPAQDDPQALFERAEEHYTQGHYEDAAAVLERLTETHPEPVLFYNLARAYESAGQLEPAIAAYGRYLEVSPDAADADAVEARIGRLRERVADEADAEAEAQPQPPPPEVDREPVPTVASPRPAIARAAPWGLLALGGSGLIAGVALVLVGSARHDAARGEPVQARAASLDDDARRLALGGNVAFAVGGALAIAGLTWGLVRLRRDRRDRVTAAPGVLRF